MDFMSGLLVLTLMVCACTLGGVLSETMSGEDARKVMKGIIQIWFLTGLAKFIILIF